MGTVEAFLSLAAEAWLEEIASNHIYLYRQSPTRTQLQAWRDSAEVLRASMTQPFQQGWTLIFEYELPREGGRRPDAIVLAIAEIWVLEFKQKASIAAADIDQTAAYERDLRLYHPIAQRYPIRSLLVLTRRQQLSTEQNGVMVVSPAGLQTFWRDPPRERTSPINPRAWVEADYAPLPSVIQAAQKIFQQEPLPAIRRVHSAGIPILLDYLNNLTLQASQMQERHLVLITGVPGAGKTLVGLQFVYQHPLTNPEKTQAVFISGNGPLIQVLQYALRNRVFVQPARNFYLHHEVRRQRAPAEHIIVFDEAQRAWDAHRMGEKYGIDRSAGGAVLRIAERIPDWAMLVVLIGEGQEIHVGEEDDIDQWQVGLRLAGKPWQVHCPSRYASVFAPVAHRLWSSDRFDLTTSLRTHQAARTQDWIGCVLSGELERAACLMSQVRREGFAAYLTRSLEAAKDYCRDRYRHKPDKRYGILASSRAQNLSQFGVANDYPSTLRVKVGPWYVDPPDSPQSCCTLEQVVTEFGSQGLELDCAIVAWGGDLVWREGGWVCTRRQRNVKDPRRLRLNSYRVLLSRGRDGVIVFAPPDSGMDSTAKALRQAGLVDLLS